MTTLSVHEVKRIWFDQPFGYPADHETGEFWTRHVNFSDKDGHEFQVTMFAKCRNSLLLPGESPQAAPDAPAVELPADVEIVAQAGV